MMLFFWKGDRLAVKRASNPDNTERSANGRPWTAIHMPCRQQIALPDPAECECRPTIPLRADFVLCSRKVPRYCIGLYEAYSDDDLEG